MDDKQVALPEIKPSCTSCAMKRISEKHGVVCHFWGGSPNHEAVSCPGFMQGCYFFDMSWQEMKNYYDFVVTESQKPF